MLWTIFLIACAIVGLSLLNFGLSVAVDTWMRQPAKPKHKPTMGKPLRVALIIAFALMCVMELGGRYAA